MYGKKIGSLKIRAGEWDTQTRDELFPHQDRIVSEIIIHESYYKGGLFNDVALLILQEPVELSEIINTACLPPQDYNFDGSRCYASGWGLFNVLILVWLESMIKISMEKSQLIVMFKNDFRKRRVGQGGKISSDFKKS